MKPIRTEQDTNNFNRLLKEARETDMEENKIYRVDITGGKIEKYTEVKVINKSKHPLPSYATSGSAGLDLRANYPDTYQHITLRPLDRVLIPTGLFIELPEGYEAQIRPRSGLANKYGITVLNAPGTIDADYRGEIKVLLVNLSNEEIDLYDGERIAQMVISKYEKIKWAEAEELSDSVRGEGGFGSSGTN